MSKVTNELITRAKALKDESLNESITKLIDLGEDATGNDKEFKTLLDLVTALENAKVDEDKKQTKDIELKGVKKFVKLQKNPFAVGIHIYYDKEFELDLTLIAKQDKKLIENIKRAINLKMIKVV